MNCLRVSDSYFVCTKRNMHPNKLAMREANLHLSLSPFLILFLSTLYRTVFAFCYQPQTTYKNFLSLFLSPILLSIAVNSKVFKSRLACLILIRSPWMVIRYYA
jgi:hypothetical protein